MVDAAGQRQSKTGRRVVAAMVACALFAAITVKPTPARADTTETIIYVTLGVSIYIAVIVIATLLIYRTATPDTSAVPIDNLLRDDIRPFPIQVGTRCTHRDGQVTLMCW